MVRPQPFDAVSTILRQRLPARHGSVHLGGCDQLGSDGACAHDPLTRRELVPAALGSLFAVAPKTPLIIPVHHIIDTRIRFRTKDLTRYWSVIWPEAVRDFERCGIRLQSSLTFGEIRRSPSGQPIFIGLEQGVINFVVTGLIPLEWDNGRGITGITTLYRGYHLCVVALRRAHGHQIPFLSVNTCVHELLHALLNDIFESRPKGFFGKARELRVDLYATDLWLLHRGRDIRQQATAYLARLQADAKRM
jgi:hypothetical protein